MISFLTNSEKILSRLTKQLNYQSLKCYGDNFYNLPYAYQDMSLLFEQPTPYTCELIFNNLEQLNAANYRTTQILQNLMEDELNPDDSKIKLIIMKGAGNKSFCSGGDLKLFYYAKNEPNRVKNYKLILEMFRYHDYETMHRMQEIKQITLPIYNGIIMGAGVGFSIFSPIRIATEKSRFAMPEIKLGYFCDCGASYFLPKFKHNIGHFLALSAKQILGYDLVAVGAATHYVPQKKIDSLQEELYKQVNENTNLQQVKSIVEKYSEHYKPSDQLEKYKSANYLNYIDKPFNEFYPHWEEYHKKDQKSFNQVSPFSLRVTYEMLQKAKNLSLKECLKMDTRIATRLMYHKEFDEGIKSVIFKQHKPQWTYKNPVDIPQPVIDDVFKPLEKNKELAI